MKHIQSFNKSTNESISNNKYILVIKQKGEGCDYTIGCGQTSVLLNASSYEEAKQESKQTIIENYTGEFELKKAIICQIQGDIDLNQIYSELREKKIREKTSKDEERERIELERLKKKFKN